MKGQLAHAPAGSSFGARAEKLVRHTRNDQSKSDEQEGMTNDLSSSDRRPEVVSLEGEIDLHESPQMMERLNPLIAKQSPRIYLDLSRVSYIDSSGLAAFIDAMQRIQAYGGEFALIAMRESVKKIFEISRLDQVFKILPSGEGMQTA